LFLLYERLLIAAVSTTAPAACVSYAAYIPVWLAQEINATAKPELQPVLTLVASLYGMTRVQTDAAFFLEAGIMRASDRCVNWC